MLGCSDLFHRNLPVQSPPLFSAVIPVFNEEDSLAALHGELAAMAEQNHLAMEIIFVDDGSRDGSWTKIQELAASDSRVQGICFRRNFGKAAALTAGFAAATGEFIITLDADLQDDPSEIPRFLEKMYEGLDCVSGWKQVRHDPWHKTGPSRVFNWLVGAMTGVKLHDHNCGFKCYRREIFDEVHLYGELHRFVPVLAASRGWKVGEIIVNHRARQHGHSKYGVTRIVKGFLDLLTVVFLTGFDHRPQHLLGTMGLVSFVFGGAGMLYLAEEWVRTRLPGATPIHLHERPVLLYSVAALLLGAQLLCMGFLAELFTFYYGRTSQTYSVKAKTKTHPEDKSS